MTTRTGERITSALVIAGLSAIALAVRLVIGLRGGFWRDEALFLSVVRLPSWEAMLDFLRLDESHPPLFYALMRLWISAFGDTDSGSIVLPVLFGVALIPVLYLVGKSLFSERVGLLAAAFAAFSPALTEYSATARPYSLMPLLALLSTYTLIRGLQIGGVRAWAPHVVSTVALLYTHNWGWLVVVGEWASILVILSIGITRPSMTRFKQWLAAEMAIGIAYLPWAATLVYQIRYAGHSAMPAGLHSSFIGSIASSAHGLVAATVVAYSPFNSSVADARWGLFFATPLVFLGLDQFLRARGATSGSSVARRARTNAVVTRDHQLAIACLLVIPVASWAAALILSGITNLILQWCLVTLAPLLLLSVAYWAQRPRSGAMLLMTRAAIFAFFLTYSVSLYQLSRTSRSNARELAFAVALRTRPTDLLVITPEWLASSFNRYYRGPLEQIDYPYLGREERSSFTKLLSRYRDEGAAGRVRERIDQARASGRRVWLIVDPEDLSAVSPTVMRDLLESPDHGLVALARTNQVNAALDTLYGAPDTISTAASVLPRYENIKALLYTPPSLLP